MSEPLSRRELIAILADVRESLPEQEAEVLWLFFADTLSFEAIGDRLGISSKSARGIFAQGLKGLQRHMGK